MDLEDKIEAVLNVLSNQYMHKSHEEIMHLMNNSISSRELSDILESLKVNNYVLHNPGNGLHGISIDGRLFLEKGGFKKSQNIESKEKSSTLNNSSKNKRKTIPVKTRAKLQKEINSSCPFCGDTSVEVFEVHHIDENSENNDITNLIMVCPTTHSKITKGEITRQEVEEKKKLLKNQGKIEFVTVMAHNECSWLREDHNSKFIFFNKKKGYSVFPVFNFSFINHTDKAILLTGIHAKLKSLPRGISGLPSSQILKPSAWYQIPLDYSRDGKMHYLENQLAIPEGHPFQVQVQFFREGEDDEKDEIDGRNVLYLIFVFNENIQIHIPNIYLNCRSEDEPIKIQFLN